MYLDRNGGVYMKKVLFFIHDLMHGGAEKVLVNLVNNMDKSKFDVTVLTLFDEGIKKTVKWYLENREWWEHIISGDYQQYYEKMYKNR